MNTTPGTRIVAGVPTGSAGTTAITLVLNGTPVKLNVAPWTTLLDALREHVGLTGTIGRKI